PTAAPLAVAAALAEARVEAPRETEVAARERFNVGLGYYRMGDFPAAVREVAAGYALSPQPQVLLNIGQAYRKMADFPRALEMYRKYLASAPPDAAERPQALEVLAEMEASLKQREVASVDVTPKATARRSRPLLVAGSAVLAVGVAGLIVGGV